MFRGFHHYRKNVLIHEEGHAKAINDILSKSINPNYCASETPIILIGDYKNKNAKPYNIKFSANCNARIIFYPENLFVERGLTLHPSFDYMSDSEIKACARAGYDAEFEHTPNLSRILLKASKPYTSEEKSFNNTDLFRHRTPCGFNSFSDAFYYYYKIFQTQYLY